MRDPHQIAGVIQLMARHDDRYTGLSTRRARVALQRILGPVGKPEIENVEYSGRQITGIR
jgi:hypothetical protein